MQLNEKQLIKNTFSKIHASGDAVQEVLEMSANNKNKRYKLRPALVAVVCVGVLACGALGANAATGGAFFQSIVRIVDADGSQNFSQVISTGNESGGEAAKEASVDFPENTVESFVIADGVGVYTTDKGESFLRIPDKADKNITDELKNNGQCQFEYTQDGMTLTATVTKNENGVAVDIGDGAIQFKSSVGSSDYKDSISLE